MEYTNDTVIRLIKMLDISCIGIYYFLLTLITSLFLVKIFPKYDKEKYKKISSFKLVLELLLRVCLIMLSVYFIRIIVKKIPFPLDGYYGYDHNRVRELNGVVIMAFSILVLQKDFKEKTELFGNRIHNFLTVKKL